MKSWSSWSIRRRLVTAFVGVLIPYLAVAGLSLAGFHFALQQMAETQHEFAEELSAVWRLDTLLDELGQAVAVAASGGATERAGVVHRVTRLRNIVTPLAAVWHDPEEQQAFEVLERLVRRLETLAAELGTIAGSGPGADTAVQAERISEVIVEAQAALGRIRVVALDEARQQSESVSMVARRTGRGILAAMALSVVGGVLLAVLFSRWITAPLRSIAAASHRMATGDLSHRVEVGAGAELDATAGAFNTMADRIETLQGDLRERVRALEDALGQVKTLSGLLPMCAWCRKIRSDTDYWQALESYITEHTDAKFSHSICPECRTKFAMTG